MKIVRIVSFMLFLTLGTMTWFCLMTDPKPISHHWLIAGMIISLVVSIASNVIAIGREEEVGFFRALLKYYI